MRADQLYREGVAAIRAGDRVSAKAKLTEAVRLDPKLEQAWLWLSAAVDTDDERVTCLQNVLTLNPDSEAARRGLEKLGASLFIDVTPAGFTEEPPIIEPEPYREPARRMEHAQSPIAESFSIVAEREPEPREPTPESPITSGIPARSSLKPEESWRAALYQEPTTHEPALNSAKFLRENKDYHEPRTVLDLVNVWGNLALFNAGRDFKDETKYGGFGHIAINIAAAGILQLLGVVIALLLISVMLRGGADLPLVRSVMEFAGPEAAAEFASLGMMESGSISMLLLGESLLLPALIAVPATFISTMIESFVIDKISGWFKGRGDVIRTMHALTTVIVVQQMVQLPLLIALPFMSFGLAAVLFGAFGLYQFALKLIAIGGAQEYDLLSSFGTLLISGFVVGVAWGIFGCFLSFIGAFAGI